MLRNALVVSIIHAVPLQQCDAGRNASRMHVLSVYDLDGKEALQASVNIQRSSHRGKEALEVVREVVSIVGGRLSYLNRVAKARDMLGMANHLKTVEKGWLLSRIGLIQDCDDDVMDEVSSIPTPRFGDIDTSISAKMEFVLLAPLARIC